MALIRGKREIEIFELARVDSELIESQWVQLEFSEWARKLDPRVITRFMLKSEETNGFTSSELLISFEASLKSGFFGTYHTAQHILTNIPEIPWFKTKTPASSFDNTPAKSWSIGPAFVDSGMSRIGVVRLIKPHAQCLDETALEMTLRDIPKPFDLSLSFERLSAAETQMMLTRKIKQSSSENSHSGNILVSAAEDAIEETQISGDSLFRIEFILTLKRHSESELKVDLASSYALLSKLGEAYVETYGVLPAVFAAIPGSEQHVPFIETGRNLPLYLPLMGFPKPKHTGLSALKVRRRDESISYIDILAKEGLNSNAVIVGASGRGKSALVGMLTHSLLKDPSVNIIKVDVGGSHSRECELLSGEESIFSLSKSSGLNPFKLIEQGITDEGARSVIANFLSVLILEKDETSLTKTLRTQIDDCIKSYIDQKPKCPSLTDFFEKLPYFPRRELLGRWCGTGLYAKAFAPGAEPEEGEKPNAPARLRYFNFSSIFEAADPEFAQAGMAAVLSEFNTQMRLNPDQRLILICDETPFFIQKCFEFFKFSSANVRKFGAGIIPVVQQSKHLIVNGDTTIIDNSFHKFLMSIDGDMEDFGERFSLSPKQIMMVDDLKTIPREYSEFYYGTNDIAMTARLRLTPEEYWRVTTTQSEKKKLEQLMAAVPSLKLEEALQCLSIS
jgi:hypothetical protein